MKNILFLTFFYSINFFAQSVSVKLKFENVSDSIPILVSKSINENAAFFLTNTDTIYIKNNQAELNFNTKNSGYLYFAFSKANPGLNILYEPNDTIVLNITKNKENKYQTHFEGKNSSILLSINTDTIYKYQKLSPKLRTIILEAKKGDEILNFIKNEHLTANSKIDSLFENGKISKSIHEIAKLHMKSSLLNNSKSIIEDIFRIEEEFINAKLSKNEFLILLNNLMLEFNPFDDKSKNLISYTFFDNIQSYSRYIAEINRDTPKHNINLFTNKKLKYNYNYIPIQYQERLFAYFLTNDVLDENDLKQFKIIFPESSYTKYLENYLKNKKKPSYNPYAFGYFINGKFEYYKQINNININSIIEDNFKGKSVFVDLWASYCTPCFQEFSYSQKLFTFLKKNNIEMLYLNIDNDKDIYKWEPNIKNNYLEGNHIFASNKAQESLRVLLNESDGIYIPRYLLFNTEGKLVLPSTKKPSEGIELYNQIINALK